MKKRFLIVIVALIFLVGCARVWHPGTTPEITLDTLGAFNSSYSVNLVNKQDDSEPQMIAYRNFVNPNEWTEYFLDVYTKELEKRGVSVSPDSPNVINVKLSDFSFIQGMWTVRAGVRLTLSSPDGSWSKEYRESDVSGWSLGRAFGSLVYHTTEKLLMDDEVMSKMRAND